MCTEEKIATKLSELDLKPSFLNGLKQKKREIGLICFPFQFCVCYSLKKYETENRNRKDTH